MSIVQYIFRIFYCFYLIFNIVNGCDDDPGYNLTVQYYETLISQSQQEAFIYPLPENAYEYISESEKETEYGTFDYIIVGAGSAGSVIATRLSELNNLNVLLIEAGGPQTPFSHIPGGMLFTQGSRINWNFKSVPQTTCCLGMIDQECPYPRGKSLGGSSAINALMYIRGNKHDFDLWEQSGNRGWGYKSILPYFIKSENSQIEGDSGYHGKGGFLNVEYANVFSPIYQAFIDANLELGRKVVDYNGKQQLGVARTQSNNFFGRRHSTDEAFLKHALRRSNLKVLTNSYVTKILIDKNKKEAYGVQFSHEKQTFIARASKEVIVSAGAISSPQLLMLSGIGPESHLKEYKIPVIKNLPVGSNLQDHPTYLGLLFTSNYIEPNVSLTQYVEDFLKNRGPLTVALNGHGLAFLQTKFTNVPNVPDVELILTPPVAITSYFKNALRYKDETYNSVYSNLNPYNTFALYVVLFHPKSVGTVKLRSSNPYDYPLIDSRFLSDPDDIDVKTMYEGIKMALDIVNAPAFKKYNASLADIRLPACKQYDYLSEDFWYCHIRQLTMNIYHPTGTCKMGPKRTKDAVVDNKLKVDGVKKLRVADASIIPSITSGHINAVAIMIGEKMADMLKSEWFLSNPVNDTLL